MHIKKIFRGFWSYIRDFCAETSFHGFSHIIAPGRSFIERIIWFILIVLSMGGFGYVVYSTWYRYQTNAIVITLEKDYRKWATYVPGIIISYIDKIEEEKARDYVNRTWGNADGEQFEYLLSFVQLVVNSSIHQMHLFEKFQSDGSLNNANFTEIISQVAHTFPLQRRYRFDYSRGRYNMDMVLMENGISFTVNSPITLWVGDKQFKKITGQHGLNMDEAAKCKYSNRNCNGQLYGMRRDFHAYVHSTFEIPNVFATPLIPTRNQRNQYALSIMDEVASTSLRSLSFEQRKCNFMDEGGVEEGIIYSASLCFMNCRRDLFAELCGCIPHFYIPKENIPMCAATGLVCASRYLQDVLQKTFGKGKNERCHCPRRCEETFINPVHVDKRRLGITYIGWDIATPSRFRVRREVVYEFTDLLVSWGGTAGLFLGCSILSGVETIFFFTARVFRRRWMKSSKPRKVTQTRQMFDSRMQRQLEYVPEELLL